MRPITKIDIITRTEKLDELKLAFAEIGVTGITVSQVFGCGLQKGHREVYRGQEYDINLVPKVKIETVVCEVPVDEVLRVAQKVQNLYLPAGQCRKNPHRRTGRSGDYR